MHAPHEIDRDTWSRFQVTGDGTFDRDSDVVAQRLRAEYREVASRYRQDDEIEVLTRNHHRMKEKLAVLSSAFGRPIAALEAGCGTGRYFHCLRNVARLVALDLSPDMLAAAEHPVRAREISVRRIEPICASIFEVAFPAGSFDFIYSLGMFGHGCPVTLELCNRFYEWLAPGGVLFFNTVDAAGEPRGERLRRRLRSLAYAAAPRFIKREMNLRERVPYFGMTWRGLRRLLRASRFRECFIEPHLCESRLWHGAHLECTAHKE